MARRSPQLATPAAVAALAVLISLEVMAIGVPAAATLASSPAAILQPEFDRRAVANLISRLGEGVRSDDLLAGLRHGQQAACHPATSVVPVGQPHEQRLARVDRRAAATRPLICKLIDLPPPSPAQA